MYISIYLLLLQEGWENFLQSKHILLVETPLELQLSVIQDNLSTRIKKISVEEVIYFHVFT